VSIRANTNYAYRQLALTFYPPFLRGDENARRADCIHDLLHATTCILADYAMSEIRRLVPENDAPKYRAALCEELTERHEAMTCDLTALVERLLSGQCLKATLTSHEPPL